MWASRGTRCLRRCWALQPAAGLPLGPLGWQARAAVPAVSAATSLCSRSTSSTANGGGPIGGGSSGARRTSHAKATKGRTRRRSSLLDLLVHLRDLDIELQEQIGDVQVWGSPSEPRWRYSDEPEYDMDRGVSDTPASYLATSVDESRAIVDPDMYEIEVQTDPQGRKIVKVVQVGSASDSDEDEESQLDEPFLPFGVHRR
mmetsp:Transcript_152933/g.490626  ORF Transcript_152933/g.490626 Transcript_152933/m.490626 type:complete len:201 (-) Transcript_152933:131-733(-)